MNKEITVNRFAPAFIKAQKEMGNAIKDSANPFFRSRYADLNSIREACIPALNNHGIAVLQPTIQVEGKNFVNTVLLHESGERMESFTEIIFAKATDAQAQGSGITYARMYGLQSLVCIGAEDDDGNKASEPVKKKNAFGLTKDGDLASGTDMKETQEQGNKETADKLIVKIKAMGSSSELEGWLENKAVKSAYAKLEKYATEDYARVKREEMAKFDEVTEE